MKSKSKKVKKTLGNELQSMNEEIDSQTKQ
jgi:hypothetical protein